MSPSYNAKEIDACAWVQSNSGSSLATEEIRYDWVKEGGSHLVFAVEVDAFMPVPREARLMLGDIHTKGLITPEMTSFTQLNLPLLLFLH